MSNPIVTPANFRDEKDRRIPYFVLFASFVVNLSGQTNLRAAERQSSPGFGQ